MAGDSRTPPAQYRAHTPPPTPAPTSPGRRSCPASGDSDADGEAIAHSVWLKAKMRGLDDLADYDQFYDGWVDQYKVEYGCYPRDPRRHFVRAAEYCRRAILAERNGGAPDQSRE